MTDTNSHLAIQANIQSITHAMNSDRERWLALYTDDAVVRDPVGISPFDANGKGHQGKEAIARFYDTVIGPSRLTIQVHKRIPSGTHACAVHQTAINDMGKGKTTVDMIAIYQVNDAGKITEMSAYWSWPEMEAQLKQLGFMK